MRLLCGLLDRHPGGGFHHGPGVGTAFAGAIVLFVACTSGALFRLWILARDFGVEVLFLDQFDFYTPFFSEASWREIFFWQHGQHRLGIAGVLQKLIIDQTYWTNLSMSVAILVCRLGWKWRTRSSVKITERAREENTKALHRGRESRHLEAAFAGAGASFQAL